MLKPDIFPVILTQIGSPDQPQQKKDINCAIKKVAAQLVLSFHGHFKPAG